jgi:hypothetical protein
VVEEAEFLEIQEAINLQHQEDLEVVALEDNRLNTCQVLQLQQLEPLDKETVEVTEALVYQEHGMCLAEVEEAARQAKVLLQLLIEMVGKADQEVYLMDHIIQQEELALLDKAEEAVLVV